MNDFYKKKRIFYIDCVRALATILIFITHYNAQFFFREPALPKLLILPMHIANVYIGDIGVSLFLIISGAALMHSYQEEFSTKKYIYKRVCSLFPMVWLAWLMAFFTNFWLYKFTNHLPLWKLIYTFLGLDGYLSFVTPTFYLVGEWFIGFIIIYYFLFPFLRKAVLKCPIILSTVLVVLYFYTIYGCNVDAMIGKNLWITMRLPELLFGMLFVTYFKSSNIYLAFLSFAIIVFNALFLPQFNQNIQVTYIGIATFLLMVYGAPFIEKSFFSKAVKIISKYSFAIFLTHHQIIINIVKRFPLDNLWRREGVLLLIICCTVTGFVSKYLFEINSKLCKWVKNRLE